MLAIQALSFQRHYHDLLQNLQCQVDYGQLLQVTGKNGAGKTTLLRLLAGLLTPTRGDVCYAGRSIYTSGRVYASQIAYLGHTNAIKPGLTVAENLLSHAALMGNPQNNINAILEQFNLKRVAEKLAYQLSQGQQRRLGLAKVVITQKPLWILDEPFAALDQPGIDQINQCLEHHLKYHGIAVIATHQPLACSVTIKSLAL